MIKSLVRTRNYFKENRSTIVNNPFMRFKYRLRRRILVVAKQNRNILFLNANFAMNNMEEVLKDQFIKLRNHYTNL